jgi:ribosome-associated protein
MDELQALGEDLVSLPVDRIKKIDLPEDLREAVREAQRMTRIRDAVRIGYVENESVQQIVRRVRGLKICQGFALTKANSLSVKALDQRRDNKQGYAPDKPMKQVIIIMIFFISFSTFYF